MTSGLYKKKDIANTDRQAREDIARGQHATNQERLLKKPNVLSPWPHICNLQIIRKQIYFA